MISTAPLSRVQALVNAGDFAASGALLVRAARGGDVPAMAALAQWAIAGTIIPRNLALARDLLGKAGAAGDLDAALLHAAFLGAGVGGAADWGGARAQLERIASTSGAARRQLMLLAKMAVDASGQPSQPYPARIINDDPAIRVYPGLLTAEECAYVTDIGSGHLQPSVVADPITGRMIPHPVRTSDAAMFGVHLEDLVLSTINRRIAAATDTAYQQGEPLQLLRYRPGTEYKNHLDALPGADNQRILTALVYLNQDYAQGETIFPKLGLSYRGAPGDALVFTNVLGDGRPDPRTLHAGRPTGSGTKLIATRWIRARPFAYPPPTPLLPRLPD